MSLSFSCYMHVFRFPFFFCTMKYRFISFFVYFSFLFYFALLESLFWKQENKTEKEEKIANCRYRWENIQLHTFSQGT